MLSAWTASDVFAGVLAGDGLSNLDLAILAIFFVCFAWISSAFWTAIAGFIVGLSGRGSGLREPADALPAGARTALVMPIYHEAPGEVGPRIASIYRSLAATGQLDHFEFFILSDSREPAVVNAEEAMWRRLCEDLDAGGRLFYRNRVDNQGRKAGNIADFCRRWGRRYRYFVVLDADSVMAGTTLVHLVRLMEANPEAGLIQTAPHPIGGATPLARILQFAAGLYGPMLARGLNYWFQDQGNYWGHNAIIRTEAFMGHAGLPTLPGSPPFGGEILSHDFVEAALLRRAGWGVWLVPELEGSYEQLPPSLSELVNRDGRWCQGNLQHLRLLTIKGLLPASRAHLLTGAIAYLASPLWLTLLVLTCFEAARAGLVPWVYFTDEANLGPVWPIARRGELLALLGATVCMLLLPRFLALLQALATPARRRAFGGAVALTRSVFAELAFSVLMAPILMVQHTRVVVATILGWRATWNGQQRGAYAESWLCGIVRYGPGTLFALVWAVAVYMTAPDLLPWLSPVLTGLILAVPIAVLSSRASLGLAARRWGWFLIPEEVAPPVELACLAQDEDPDSSRSPEARVVPLLDPAMQSPSGP